MNENSFLVVFNFLSFLSKPCKIKLLNLFLFLMLPVCYVKIDMSHAY